MNNELKHIYTAEDEEITRPSDSRRSKGLLLTIGGLSLVALGVGYLENNRVTTEENVIVSPALGDKVYAHFHKEEILAGMAVALGSIGSVYGASQTIKRHD